jgi:lambda family phage portal protein
MNYDAASKGRRTYGWKAPGTAADSAAGANRARLRNLSRDMIRNRSLAARGQAVVTGNVVGTGIMPSVRMADGDDATAAMEVIRDHLLTPAIDVYGVNALPGIQTQIMNTVFADGEVLVRRRMRDLRFEPGLQLPFQVQVLEVDHLDETIFTNGQNEVIDGIEYGPTGKAVAYHLFDQHPGDNRRITSGRFTSTRVPAQQILHIRRLDRPGQMRGVPWLAPVMMTLGELSDYQEAQILKQRIAALLAFFVEAGEDGAVYDGKDLAEIGPGSVVGLQAGQKMVASQPPTVDGYPDFMREGIRTIATGLGLTYESFGDLTGVNFSSGRMGRMEMDRFIQVWQQQIIIGELCNGLAGWTLDTWPLVQISRGLPAAPKALEWTAPRRPLIDPSKEIGAAIEEIDAGLNSRQRKQREMGLDPDVIARERAEDAARDAVLPQRPGPRPEQLEEET